MTKKPTTQKRPPPPAGLPESAAALWVSICAGLPVNHFQGADLVLLQALVIADHQKRACDALVARDGPVTADGANPALKLSITLAGSMAGLAAKLRLCKSSTTRAESAGLKRALAGSAFEDNDLSHFFTGDRPHQ